MADLEKIAEELSALTVMEAAELSSLLEEKWGVSAAAPVAVAAVAGGLVAACFVVFAGLVALVASRAAPFAPWPEPGLCCLPLVRHLAAAAAA